MKIADPTKLKQNLVEETRKFLLYSLILLIFFNAFTLYRMLILKEYGIDLTHLGFNLVQSLLLAKVIVIGEALGLGERYHGKMLIIPTLYKTVIFLIFVLLFSIAEHFLIDFIHGKNIRDSFQVLIDYRLYQILSALVVMSFFFVLFFAFMELGKALGSSKLYDLFFKSTNVKK